MPEVSPNRAQGAGCARSVSLKEVVRYSFVLLEVWLGRSRLVFVHPTFPVESGSCLAWLVSEGLNVLPELGPTLESIFASHDQLSIAQREARRPYSESGWADKSGMEFLDSSNGLRLTNTPGFEEILCLVFQMIQIRSGR
jgi:hypothetical protein